ncbi:MAG: 3-deoxy-7-phosphoheptulonate synthase, partial [Fibrobacteres bacterium]|nr:3-deoxy-7-phosphoheptulonate synthase [Fibrobacterota bacterium]
MIIVLKPQASKNDADEIQLLISEKGLKPLYMPGVERTVIGAIGDERKLNELHLDSHPAVETITPVLSPYKLVSREFKPEGSVVKIGKATVGGSQFMIIGGPCAVESRDQILSTAAAVKSAGAQVLRGGAYKPRSSPYSFQGLEEEGLKLLKEASNATSLPFVTEVVEVTDIDTVVKYADAVQVGARNMQNFR